MAGLVVQAFFKGPKRGSSQPEGLKATPSIFLVVFGTTAMLCQYGFSLNERKSRDIFIKTMLSRLFPCKRWLQGSYGWLLEAVTGFIEGE
ncbi:hypothetical protein [Agrobacterium bohemicum]|uniref:hypothetical protein n=1 Tax=Agrobacterium bohemicum TaxID=2052828 RepID=UPI0012FFD8C3|nr:hypothetical protein [Agrobacterium bohemicum]